MGAAVFDLSPLDLVGLAWFGIAWIGYSLVVREATRRRRCLSAAMDEQRRRWMRTMLKRDLRMIDTAIMAGLQNGTAFFASTALLAIGGGFALLGSTDQVYGVFRDLALEDEIPRGVFEFKALGLTAMFIYGFFKFAWSYRLFNYATIFLGAVPGAAHAHDPETIAAADRAGEFTVSAGRHFNHGLRSFFFALGYLGWFVNAWFFIAATALVFVVLVHRQFFSVSARIALAALDAPPSAPPAPQATS